jgi:hypothetical protein
MIGAPPPDFTAIIGGVPEAATAWAPVGAQLTAEGVDPGNLYIAQQEFASAFNSLAGGNSPVAGSTQLGASDFANAAAGFVTQNRTILGAVGTVGGLVEAAVTNAPPAQVIQAFSGLLVAGATAAVAAGAVSAGIGAAVIVGLELAATAISDLLGNPAPPAAVLCSSTLSQVPTFSFACAACDGQAIPAGPASPLWRQFPNVLNTADTAWFYQAPFGTLVCIVNFDWSPGDHWFFSTTTSNAGSCMRPIDAAFPAYHQLELDVVALTGKFSAEQIVTMQSFYNGFIAAWRTNREYQLNGLATREDWEVLLLYTRLWNTAHAAGDGYEFTLPYAGASSSHVVSPTTASDPGAPLYVELLVGDLQANASSSLTGGTTLHVNTGAANTPPNAAGTPVPGGAGAPAPAANTSGLGVGSGLLIGTGIAAVGGLGAAALLAYSRGVPVQSVLKSSWRDTQQAAKKTWSKAKGVFRR